MTINNNNNLKYDMSVLKYLPALLHNGYLQTTQWLYICWYVHITYLHSWLLCTLLVSCSLTCTLVVKEFLLAMCQTVGHEITCMAVLAICSVMRFNYCMLAWGSNHHWLGWDYFYVQLYSLSICVHCDSLLYRLSLPASPGLVT